MMLRTLLLALTLNCGCSQNGSLWCIVLDERDSTPRVRVMICCCEMCWCCFDYQKMRRLLTSRHCHRGGLAVQRNLGAAFLFCNKFAMIVFLIIFSLTAFRVDRCRLLVYVVAVCCVRYVVAEQRVRQFLYNLCSNVILLCGELFTSHFTGGQRIIIYLSKFHPHSHLLPVHNCLNFAKTNIAVPVGTSTDVL